MTVDEDPVEEDPTTAPEESPEEVSEESPEETSEEVSEESPEEAEPVEWSALQRFMGKFRKS